MSEEGFLRRWARRKAKIKEGRELPPEPETAAPVPARVPAAAERAGAAERPAGQAVTALQPEEGQVPLPTMDDVASLTRDSDFSAFVARGVDQTVRRSALKKLFADPHFNVMDRLDIYIDDYTKPSPMSEEMLASLSHVKNVLMRTLDDEEEKPSAAEPAPMAPASQAQQEPQEPQEPQAQQPPEQETQ